MTKIRLDRAGLLELLKSSEVAGVVSDAAGSVASAAASAPEVTRNGMTVDTRDGVSDRARTTVTITHAGGLGVQAKHGTLTRAVSAAGLTFRPSRGGE